MSQQVPVPASDLDPGAVAVLPTSSDGRSRSVRMAALPSAVPWARRILRHMLHAWQLEEMSDPALLLVSELVTNAVQASVSQAARDGGRWPMIGLTLQLTDTALVAEVWDTSPAVPVVQEADLTEERGRGLVLVDFLADSWGHRAAGNGKVVWCMVAIPSEPAEAN